MGTPNYVLTEKISIVGATGSKTLEAGSFVRPVRYEYLPRHVKDKYNPIAGFIWVYTHYGLAIVQEDQVRQV